MNIQGFQKLTLLDFPGKVAATVFTGGCNLRCPFCHNARLVRAPLAFDTEEAEVLSYLERRRGILDGVCITGGEPMLQEDLADFTARLHDMGYAVKLDTNGSFPQKLRKLLAGGTVDYVAMDVKSSPAGYPAATGCHIPFETFAESIKVLRESGVAYEFRTTVVKGIHKKEDLVEIAKLLGDEPYFLQRFVDSGNLLGEGCDAFSEDEMRAFLAAVRRFAPRAALRGQEE